ncbi:lecithin retinol acyltransferase family protein [Burkholderia sp. Ac-20365]|uniref:lecithin retinol acyltransferase family protein n=1 Tax=Burkholderia sp. Ac-20365 TaxID=2703897 RepID=UPI00197C3C90|nr:lecithin retinol acyltransferase family protein [Burkholderia sp. Ac-20365]MBN3761379.1 hypothetical protein [Burkholderia sp. Ac-20365]
MIQGDHLVAQFAAYKHHGLYLGNDHVMQYTGPSSGAPTGLIECVSLATFAEHTTVTVFDHPRRTYGREASIARAWSRHREATYHLWENNCEHFVFWCIEGEHASLQTEALKLGMIAAGRTVLSHAELGGLVTIAAASAELLDAYTTSLASPQLAASLGSVTKRLSAYAHKRKAPLDQIENLQKSVDAVTSRAARLMFSAGAGLVADAIEATIPALEQLKADAPAMNGDMPAPRLRNTSSKS